MRGMGESDNVAVINLCQTTLADSVQAVTQKFGIQIANADQCGAIGTGNTIASTSALRDVVLAVMQRGKESQLTAQIAAAPLDDVKGTLGAFAPTVHRYLQNAVGKTGTISEGVDNNGKVILIGGYMGNHPYVIALRLHQKNSSAPICQGDGCLGNSQFIPTVERSLQMIHNSNNDK